MTPIEIATWAAGFIDGIAASFMLVVEIFDLEI